MATSPSSLPKPQAPNSTAVPYPSPPNSPRPNKSPTPEVPKASKDEEFASTAHDKPERDKHNVSELKTRLGLERGLCGALTKSEQPCRCRLSAAKKALVVSQLESMADLTQSSPGLDAALDKLVMLVHCRNHDNSIPKMSRISSWVTEFPVGEACTDPATSVEKQIRKILDLASTQCIAMESSTQCRHAIGGQRVQNCAATIADIARAEVYLDDAYLEGLLRVLETNMFCPEHIGKQPLKRVEMWKSAVGEIRGKPPVTSNAPQGITSPSGHSTLRSSEKFPTKRGHGVALQSGGLSIPNFRRDLSAYWPAAFDVSPFNIIPESNGPARSISPHDKVKRKMMDKLIPDDLFSGYVYAYEVEGNPGYVKIGYTTRSVEARHEEWKFACNRVPKVLYPMPPSTISAVSNVRRVEALCHAELIRRRIRIDCKGCLKQHLEWFKVSPAEAIAVIQKWSGWMASGPYQRIELRSGVSWTIKEKERKRALDMDCFMREISEAL